MIAGYGRVGRYSADILQRLNLPCVVVDLDYHAVEQAKASGLPVVYGDASSPIVLEAAGIHTARLALVVVSAEIDVELIVRQIRQLNPELHIFNQQSRGRYDALRRGYRSRPGNAGAT